MASQKQDMLEGTIHRHESKTIKILKYSGTRSVKVQIMETGTVLITQPCHIRTGKIKDKNAPSIYGIGFIGYGKYKASKKEPAYTKWKNMMQRCYCEIYLEKNKTYKDCYVCDEWHNFQLFAEWYYLTLPKDGLSYQLDKDIVKEGNKLYSPSTCLFVTKHDNVVYANAKEYNFNDPDGNSVSILNLCEFCNGKEINPQNMGKLHAGKIRSYKGWTKWQK